MTVPTRAVHLAELLLPERSHVDRHADTKDEVLAQVAEAAAAALGGDVATSALLAALKEREEVGTTGFGRGIAIPHCRMEDVDRFVVCLLVFPDGAPFEAVDDQDVQLVFSIVGPKEGGSSHVHLLAEVSRVLRDEEACRELLAARTGEALCESFLRHVRDDFEPEDPKGRHLLHLVVQDEELFRDLLEALTALKPHAITVVEGRNPASYLMRLPLFAGLLQSEADQFCRIVMACIDRRLTNEAIRRIQEITGDLRRSRRVQLMVQELHWAAGALDW